MAILGDLPSEVLLRILSLLRSRERLDVSLVSRLLHALVTPLCYRNIFFVDRWSILGSLKELGQPTYGRCISSFARTLNRNPTLRAHITILRFDCQIDFCCPYTSTTSSIDSLLDQLSLKQLHFSLGKCRAMLKLPTTTTSISARASHVLTDLIPFFHLPDLEALDISAFNLFKIHPKESLGSNISSIRLLNLRIVSGDSESPKGLERLIKVPNSLQCFRHYQDRGTSVSARRAITALKRHCETLEEIFSSVTYAAHEQYGYEYYVDGYEPEYVAGVAFVDETCDMSHFSALKRLGLLGGFNIDHDMDFRPRLKMKLPRALETVYLKMNCFLFQSIISSATISEETKMASAPP